MAGRKHFEVCVLPGPSSRQHPVTDAEAGNSCDNHSSAPGEQLGTPPPSDADTPCEAIQRCWLRPTGRSYTRIGPEFQTGALPQPLPLTKLVKTTRQSEAPLSEPRPSTSRTLERDAAHGTALMLTAAAFGQLAPFCFIWPCDCGLGLFAREPLEAGQFICE